jgi:ubiquinol-cytochrome c reductase iron-sulfur subunit
MADRHRPEREPVPRGTTADTPPTVAPEPLEPPPPEATMAAERRKHGERLPAALFIVSILAGIGLAIVYWRGGQVQLEGILLALALGGFGGGMVLWAKRFMPAGPEVEPRGRMGSTEDEIAAFAADFDVGEYELERRGLMVKLMLGAGAALGLAVLFPVRSLGPRPGDWLVRSPFRRGTRLVDEAGAPVRPGDLAVDGVITVFPEDDLGDDYAQTLLIRLDPGRPFSARPGREDWTPDGLVAYSKVCTHAGCPVGLFEARFGQLLCPCHQSTFDVYDGSRPVFGPAAKSLPQLPLAVDDDGFVVAAGGFSDPIGPGYWNQERQWEADDEGEGS